MMDRLYSVTKDECGRLLKTDTKNGLSDSEAKKRLKRDGKNRLKDRKRKSIIMMFLSQLNDFMVIILLVSALISFITALINQEGFYDSLIILAIVLLNSIIGTVEEFKAQKSLEALKKLSAPHASVIRDGKEKSILAEEVVKGDVLVLRSGDIVSADCRIIEAFTLSADESALTGESEPAEKSADIIPSDTHSLGDIKNMLFSSTFITNGSAKAIVTQTGMDTEIGKIASMLSERESTETPLQKYLSHIGKVLGIGAILICAFIFLIGILKNMDVAQMFITSVSLAVAAIPEGLVAIVTITLALGVTRLSKHNAIIRNLPSVETLGLATVICSDKTGTLTENKMSVSKLEASDIKLLLRYGLICTENNTKNPTELAIINAAKEKGIDNYQKEFLDIIPFNSKDKSMSVMVKDGDGYLSIIKGASEKVLEKCDMFYDGAKAIPLTNAIKSKIKRSEDKWARDGLRVIAICYRVDNIKPKKIPDSHFVFLGILGLWDAPRREAHDAVLKCTRAGIMPIMITGDHKETAKSIAISCGICDENDTVITGAELDKMNDTELISKIRDIHVFARVTPLHKLRIVKAWQSIGEVVAMTGDGVNDAPALKRADIGCSMGINGTDVAKDASDMVLADDNFATIVLAIREGRTIFKNIKKAVHFLLSSNIGEVFAVFCGVVFGLSSPLTASQLLWINLVTDSLPAIALGIDKGGDSIMEVPPHKGTLFTKSMWLMMVIEGTIIGTVSLIAFLTGLRFFNDLQTARTMAFAVLSISELVQAFNVRSDDSIFPILFTNKQLNLAFLIGVVLTILIISVPSLAVVFGVVALGPIKWLIVFCLSLLPLIISEAQKKLNKNLKRN